MFLDQFKESFAKLMAMRNKEELEGLEKRLKEVKKLYFKRKKRLEIDENSIPPSSKQNERQSKERKKSDNDQDKDSNEYHKNDNDDKEEINQRESKASKPFESKKPFSNMPVKSKGGDPHGAFAKREQEEIDRLKREQAERDSKRSGSRSDQEKVRILTYYTV